MEIVIVPKDQLDKQLHATVLEALKNYGLKPAPADEPCYTVNQVAKRLGMAHQTVGKLVRQGTIKTTKSGRITEDAIREYLDKK